MAEKKKGSSEIRAVEGAVHQFAVLGEMTGLLQRVRGNKSKRTESALLKTGPFRVNVIALDDGGEVQAGALDGPYTLQCLLGRVRLSVGGREQRLSTGDVLVAETPVSHAMAAEEASVLLLTVAVAES